MVGANDCMSEEFDLTTSTANYEKLIYTCAHKFTPKTVTVCSITPLTSFRKEQNENVKKMNTKLKALVKNIKDLGEVELKLHDFYGDFQQHNNLVSSDGVHPTEQGVRALVETYRVIFHDNGIEISDSEITVRPKFSQPFRNNHNQMREFFQKGYKVFKTLLAAVAC